MVALLEVPVNAVELIVTFTVALPTTMLAGVKSTSEVELATVNTMLVTPLLVTNTLDVELPTVIPIELIADGPTETAIVLTKEEPILKLAAVKLAVAVEFAICNRELFCVAFTEVLPSKILEGITVLTTVKFAPKITLPETLAVPVTVNDASGDVLLIPTRAISPLAKIKLVFTIKPFFTTKSFSAIVPFPLWLDYLDYCISMFQSIKSTSSLLLHAAIIDSNVSHLFIQSFTPLIILKFSSGA